MHEFRAKLQNSFEKLFFDEDNLGWKKKLAKSTGGTVPASLYPLTAYTEVAQTKIANSHIQSSLRCDFRSKLITPYIQADGSTFHRRAVTFSEHDEFLCSNYAFFDQHAGDSFQHLLE